VPPSTSFCATDRRAHLRIAAVVFRLQHPFDLLAANRDALGVQVFDGQARAVFDVLALVRAGTGQRRSAADLDDGLGMGSGGEQRQGGGNGETEETRGTHGGFLSI
jgi:hypothetical protein